MKTHFRQANVAVLAMSTFFFINSAAAGDDQAWDKTFAKSEKVIHQKVFYPNRYGITIAADMYMPKDIDMSKKYSAILVGTPYGGVKEQGAGIYAQTMAERGFVAMAFDESFNGESSGQPRHVSSPDIFVEDFSAGVDFPGTRPFVDKEKIGVIGICGSGGFTLTAAQVDHRIKAVVTASMYDMSRVIRNDWKDLMTDEQRSQVLDQLGRQRWKDFENGSPLLPALLAGKVDAIMASMSITEEWKQSVAFSDKYYEESGSYVIRKSSGLDLSREGLKGKVIGVQRSTTWSNYIESTFPEARIVYFDDDNRSCFDLIAGRIDTYLAQSYFVSQWVKKPEAKNLEIAGNSVGINAILVKG